MSRTRQTTGEGLDLSAYGLGHRYPERALGSYAEPQELAFFSRLPVRLRL